MFSSDNNCTQYGLSTCGRKSKNSEVAIGVGVAFLGSGSSGDYQLSFSNMSILLLACVCTDLINKNNTLGMGVYMFRILSVPLWALF
jgi:hypothetical protein